MELAVAGVTRRQLAVLSAVTAPSDGILLYAVPPEPQSPLQEAALSFRLSIDTRLLACHEEVGQHARAGERQVSGERFDAGGRRQLADEEDEEGGGGQEQDRDGQVANDAQQGQSHGAADGITSHGAAADDALEEAKADGTPAQHTTLDELHDDMQEAEQGSIRKGTAVEIPDSPHAASRRTLPRTLRAGAPPTDAPATSAGLSVAAGRQAYEVGLAQVQALLLDAARLSLAERSETAADSASHVLSPLCVTLVDPTCAVLEQAVARYVVSAGSARIRLVTATWGLQLLLSLCPGLKSLPRLAVVFFLFFLFFLLSSFSSFSVFLSRFVLLYDATCI